MVYANKLSVNGTLELSHSVSDDTAAVLRLLIAHSVRTCTESKQTQMFIKTPQ